nr:Fic family protein [Ruminococcus sp.]
MKYAASSITKKLIDSYAKEGRPSALPINVMFMVVVYAYIMAGSYASNNMYRTIDVNYVCELEGILTDGMDNGSPDFRSTDETDYVSPNGEQFRFPPPQALPSLLNSLCTFLADGNVHPLIKSAVAQAYMTVIRPFPEGNDRLGRILSSVILLRSGYTFFSELSLSALIARRGYAYYEATANILREENADDMTYFVEYFLELLSRAVDERRLRTQNAENELRQAEIEMARTTLSPPSHTGPPEDMIAAQETEVTSEENSYPDGFYTVSPNEAEPSFDDSNSLEISLARVRDELYGIVNGGSTIMKSCAKLLLNIMNNNIFSFTALDIQKGCQVTMKQASNLIVHMREKGLIESSEQRINGYVIYQFGKALPPLIPEDYSEDILKVINELRSSKYSRKEKDIG